ncbi:hypothetical protein BKA70DRAFT_382476 [Coprinopsis sp. MPI-PUGE-AT-0042]|nr:hypothetical protein BKA70DRAFT_382476 [Coprinopsis sp. MPI-PUGE-AT-0042]
MEPPVINPALIPYTLTNTEIPQDLAAICRQNLGEVDCTLDGVNRRIDALKRELEELNGRQIKLKGIKNTCHGLLSPLRRFPNELVAQIIRSCLPELMLLDATDRKAFTILRCVCKQWRVVAFTSPELWRGLSAEWADVKSTPEIAQRLTSWFNRAGEHLPLKLDLHYGSLSDEQAVNALISLLMEPSRSWVHLSLKAGGAALQRLASKLKAGLNCWNRLQYLKLASGHIWERGHSGSDLLFSFINGRTTLSNLPALKTLHLADMSLPTMNGPSPPAHPTLTTLRLDSCGIAADVMKTLFNPQNFPCLHNVELTYVWHMSDEEPVEFATTVHPGIKSIYAQGENLFDILPILSLPNLEFATVRSHSRFQDDLLQAFFEISGSHVRTLVFDENSVTIAKLSRHLSSLRHLLAPGLEIFEDLMSVFRSSGTTSLPFTLLQTVVCTAHLVLVTGGVVDAILAYTERRWATMENPTPLTIKVLEFIQADSDELLQRIRGCSWLRIEKVSLWMLRSLRVGEHMSVEDVAWMFPEGF